ncbi:hypothetical protein MPSI1_003592 [Malassezia psittaci]|uniref:Uncharacterized protein n=1 Tax=Malassezia psittaci TaxID=1821823 RepID=A0AAF0FI38_9BASI|nr:hypothetical protein MPSI1_003592 [Malassezia psittaci]
MADAKKMRDFESNSPSTTAVPVSKRAKYTPNGLQATALEKLMRNPDKEIKLPEPAMEKSVRPPPDIVPNVGSSTAGAGSGEFHVYTQSRQREYQRLNILAEKAQREAEHAHFVERQTQLSAEHEKKTARNRARRDKKKAAAGRVKAQTLNPSSISKQESATANAKTDACLETSHSAGSQADSLATDSRR